MLYEIISFLNTALFNCRDWFVYLLGSTGMTSYYVAMLFVAILGRFILSPLFGFAMGVGVGSDLASKQNHKYYGDPNQKRLKGK